MKMLQWVVSFAEMLHRLHKVLMQKRVDDVGLLCSDPVPRPAITDQHPQNKMVIGQEPFSKLSIWLGYLRPTGKEKRNLVGRRFRAVVFCFV
jgi:hypothetical protein